jgi:peptidylprolyl isomerase
MVLSCLALAGCKSTGESTTTTSTTAGAAVSTPPKTEPPVASSGATEGQERTLPGGLRVIDIKVGSGPMAELGKSVSVHYTGWLTDGTKFDSSVDRGEPIAFPLGTPNIIQGWNEGLKGMRVGGKRKLTIPSGLAYGDEGRPPVIPPGATLVFDVELMDVR